jgi:hypothetical protein
MRNELSHQRWISVMPNLTTHCWETLVRFVAKARGIDDDLGIKGTSGVLKSVVTRRQFLQEKNHRIRFVYVPKHTSWLNQIEIWFSIVVRRVIAAPCGSDIRPVGNSRLCQPSARGEPSSSRPTGVECEMNFAPPREFLYGAEFDTSR